LSFPSTLTTTTVLRCRCNTSWTIYWLWYSVIDLQAWTGKTDRQTDRTA